MGAPIGNQNAAGPHNMSGGGGGHNTMGSKGGRNLFKTGGIVHTTTSEGGAFTGTLKSISKNKKYGNVVSSQGGTARIAMKKLSKGIHPGNVSTFWKKK